MSVFCIWCSVFSILICYYSSHKFYAKHQTPNTIHQTLDEFDLLKIHKNLIFNIRTIDSNNHMKCACINFYRHPHLEAETTL